MPTKKSLTTKLTDQQVRAINELHRRKMTSDLRYFAEAAIPALVPAEFDQRIPRHLDYLIDQYNLAFAGDVDVIILSVPPGHAKSTLSSVIVPTFAMARRDKFNVICASNTQLLAEEFSTKVQALMEEFHEVLGCRPATTAKERWKATNDSAFLAAGCGGTITGFRADLFLIDDPIRKRTEAYNPKFCEDLWNWYATEVNTRLRPGGKIIVIATRWSTEDLSGKLIEKLKLAGKKHKVINLPAIWEEEEPDVFGREYGEVLWPEYMTLERLTSDRALIGELDWQSLYQGNPLPEEGHLFKISKLQEVDAAPAHYKKRACGYDFASTEKMVGNNPDWTVSLHMQRNLDDTYTILDVKRVREGPEGVRKLVLDTAAEHGHGTTISLPIDPGGKWAVNDLTKALAGYVVESSRETGSKQERARAFAAQLNAGNVSIVKDAADALRRWNEDFRYEIASFPACKFDDQVDASSRAFAALTDLQETYSRPKWGHNPFMRR